MEETYNEFEKNFTLLLEKGKEQPVSLREFLNRLSGKGKILFLIFFALPFSQIPGIAVFFGILIAYLGLRIGLNKKSIWLPKRLLEQKISSYFLQKAVNQILFVLRLLKKGSRSRYAWASTNSIAYRLSGWMIALVGLSLASSPPVPIVGMIAFAAVLFIGIGLLNEDGIYLLIGCLLSVAYFSMIIFILKVFSLSAIIEFLRNLF